MGEKNFPVKGGFEKALELEEKCLSGLYRQFASPTLKGQQVKRYSVENILGCITLAFHRGRQSGKEEAT